MAELQSVAHDGRMSSINSYYPNSGYEPNTSSALPIRMHPSHGNSLHAHPAMMSEWISTWTSQTSSHGTALLGPLELRQYTKDSRLLSTILGGGGLLAYSTSGSQINAHSGV